MWLGDTVHIFEPGTVFVLPGGVRMDVVNIPAERSSYESLVLEVPSLPPRYRRWSAVREASAITNNSVFR